MQEEAAKESGVVNSPTKDKTTAEKLDGDATRVKVEPDTLVKEEENADGNSPKRQKVEISVKKEKLENSVSGSGPVSLGPKQFQSSVEMFDFFFKFLHHWPPNVDINKFEHTVLLDLLKKGHPMPDKKIGPGVKTFQIRYHPLWKSRCFFIVRDDETVDDFSFKKCVDHILPLPEDMKLKPEANKTLGKGGGKGHSGKGSGRG